MPHLPSPWRSDFSAIPAAKRRVAHYALRLSRAMTSEIPLDSRSEGNGFITKLLLPLFDQDGMTRCLAADGDTVEQPAADDEQERAIWEQREDERRDRLILDRVCQMSRRDLARLAMQDGREPVNPALRVVGQALQLTELENQLLDYLEQCLSDNSMRTLLCQFTQAKARDNCRRLAKMLNADVAAVRAALAPQALLRSLGLVKFSDDADLEDFIQPSDLLRSLLEEGAVKERDDLLARFIEPVPAAAWAVRDFPHLDRACAHVGTVLRQGALAGEAGVNALFYGPTGTGKTELARALAAQQSLRAYQVRAATVEGYGLKAGARLSAYLLAQRLLSRQRDTVLIFDAVEDVVQDLDNLVVELDGKKVGMQKNWLNRLLEENPVPAIWITNNIEEMAPAFLQRFLLPVAFDTPRHAVRRQMAERHLGAAGIPPGLLDELAADPALTPALLGAAGRLVRLRPDTAPAEVVREGVKALRALVQGGATAPRQRQRAIGFNVEFLNLGGDISPSAIVRALGRRGRGSLCFYGPPGTGKTAFAEILAEALDRELDARLGSELVSSWVGETEQNLAKLFREIDPQRTVLLLDEVDSFLMDRSQARNSWERTQVNELLQQMERFPGIFVAATNLMSGLDAAALRRFDFKLNFRALNPVQRRKLFAREVLGDQEAALPAEIERHLGTMHLLAPGDFANVCRQRELLDETLTPQQFLRRLMQECRFKQKGGALAA
jgi:SpoVK/Ycf46/Vps4 family AAA+-type ATPase